MNVPSSFRINDRFGFTRLRRNSAAGISFFAILVLALLAVLRLGAWLAAPAAAPIAADAVVVLGGDGGNGRTTRAGELFRAGFARQVVLTGNAGKPGKSVDARADPRVALLIDMGCRPQRCSSITRHGIHGRRRTIPA